MTTIKSFQHNLGLVAVDPISEFEGVIVSRVHYLFGCSQYGLASKKNNDGSIPNTEYFDEARISIVEEKIKTDRTNEFSEIFAISLGKKARDKVTGFTGIISYAIEYLYGSTQYGLLPQIDKDGKVGEGQQFDEGRIEIIDDGIKPEDVQTPIRGGVNRDAPRGK
jgi:hypothetical protein